MGDAARATLSVQHPPGHRVIQGVRRHFHDILDLHPQHTALIRMDEVGAVVIDDETVRLLRKALLVTLVDLGVFPVMTLTQPPQRHVGTQHTHLPATLIVDMGQVGRRELLRGSTVQIRGCPVVFLLFEGSFIPGMHQEVGMTLVHLLASDHP